MFLVRAILMVSVVYATSSSPTTTLPSVSTSSTSSSTSDTSTSSFPTTSSSSLSSYSRLVSHATTIPSSTVSSSIFTSEFTSPSSALSPSVTTEIQTSESHHGSPSADELTLSKQETSTTTSSLTSSLPPSQPAALLSKTLSSASPKASSVSLSDRTSSLSSGTRMMVMTPTSSLPLTSLPSASKNEEQTSSSSSASLIPIATLSPDYSTVPLTTASSFITIPTEIPNARKEGRKEEMISTTTTSSMTEVALNYSKATSALPTATSSLVISSSSSSSASPPSPITVTGSTTITSLNSPSSSSESIGEVESLTITSSTLVTPLSTSTSSSSTAEQDDPGNKSSLVTTDGTLARVVTTTSIISSPVSFMKSRRPEIESGAEDVNDSQEKEIIHLNVVDAVERDDIDSNDPDDDDHDELDSAGPGTGTEDEVTRMNGGGLENRGFDDVESPSRHFHTSFQFNRVIVYISSSMSLVFLMATLFFQMYIYRSVNSRETELSGKPFVLLNLLSALSAIQLVFLLGGPFRHDHQNSHHHHNHHFPRPYDPLSLSSRDATSLPVILSSQNVLTSLSDASSSASGGVYHQSSSPSNSALSLFPSMHVCNFYALLLHFLHLASAFWMLSHSIFLYQRLWRPVFRNKEISSSIRRRETIVPAGNPNDFLYPVLNHLQESSSSAAVDAVAVFSEDQNTSGDEETYSVSTSSPIISSSLSIFSCLADSCCCCLTSSPFDSDDEDEISDYAIINGSNGNSNGSRWDSRHFFIFSWLMPLLIIISSYHLSPEDYETQRYCWMSIEGGMVFSFIVPILLLIMANTGLMLLVLKRFFNLKPITHKTEIRRVEPSLRAGVTLLPFFAVNWFLSVLALEDTSTTAFQYIFGITNFMQSLLAFLLLFHQQQRGPKAVRLMTRMIFDEGLEDNLFE